MRHLIKCLIQELLEYPKENIHISDMVISFKPFVGHKLITVVYVSESEICITHNNAQYIIITDPVEIDVMFRLSEYLLTGAPLFTH